MVIPWKIQWKLVILTHVALYRLWLFRNFFFKFVRFDICERAWFKSRVAPPPGSVAPIVAKKKCVYQIDSALKSLIKGEKERKKSQNPCPKFLGQLVGWCNFSSLFYGVLFDLFQVFVRQSFSELFKPCIKRVFWPLC